MLGKNGLCKVFHNGIRERYCSKVFVRGYFHFLLYRRLRVPATFLKSPPPQLLLFKYFDWLIHTGFSLIIVLFCFVLFLSTLRAKENNQKKTETHADLNTELHRIFSKSTSYAPLTAPPPPSPASIFKKPEHLSRD